MDTTLLRALDKDGREEFQHAMAALQGDLTATMATLNIDPKTRLEYGKRIQQMSDELFVKASRGAISWEAAATEASQTRNLIMELMRYRTTPVGKAIAEKMKQKGKTLNELIARKTLSIFGSKVTFDQLSQTQKDKVYAAIVKSAGSSNMEVNVILSKLTVVGKGLVFLTLAVAVYQIYESNDRISETSRQATLIVAGAAGGWAGGAIAGLMCGPAAPVCVIAGAFIGGALAAWEMDRIRN